MAKAEKDPVTGQYTTGHDWNGIHELRTPVPQWWLIVWLVSIAVSVIYVVLLPAIPMGTWATPGLLHYTARKELQQEMAEVNKKNAKTLAEIAKLPLEKIVADPKLERFAYSGGRSAFAVNCAPCHGANAGGQAGQFPSLIDDDWLWGGTLKDIYYTIYHGIRSGAAGAHGTVMPTFGTMLSQHQISDLADYVLALNPKSPAYAKRQSMPGAKLFASNCAGCHGATGNGNEMLGAPRLNDAIWLYSGKKSAIMAQITHPRLGVMPSFDERLHDNVAKIKMLAIYVHSLGGGVPDPADKAAGN